MVPGNAAIFVIFQTAQSPSKDNFREEYVKKFSAVLRLMPGLNMTLNTRPSLKNARMFS